MSRIIISKTLITDNDFLNGAVAKSIANAEVDIDSVTRVTAGYNLIYVEYVDADNNMCTRAFGRTEFETLVVSGDRTLAFIPLKDELFEKITFRFPIPNNAGAKEVE